MHVLIVDDEETARYGMSRALSSLSSTVEAENLTEARALLRSEPVDLVLLDLKLGPENGFELLDELMDIQFGPEVIVITAHGNEATAVKAMQKGAFHYLGKPFDLEELRSLVRSVRWRLELQRQNRGLRAELAATSGYGDLIGGSEPMRQVYALIDRVAETDVTVLLTGESGSGKELVAREIHRRSPRCEGPLVSVNCAAIPSDLIESELFGHEKGAFTGATNQRIGKFEQAQGGTLFLDEIGDMPADTQAKILRALEDRHVQRLGGRAAIPVNVRILSATNQDLPAMVRQGRFREDLYYRLQVVEIPIPALRQRRDDLPDLIDYFLNVCSVRHSRSVPRFTPAAMQRLLLYSYPGNVRQLRNIVERLVVLQGDRPVREGDLPEEVRFFVPGEETGLTGSDIHPLFQLNYKEAKKAFEIRYLCEALARHEHNITHTAADIGIHRQSLQQRVKILGLTKPEE